MKEVYSEVWFKKGTMWNIWEGVCIVEVCGILGYVVVIYVSVCGIVERDILDV